MTVKELFLKDYIILDGGMGTMLQAKGMETGTIPETLNILKPDWIIDVHRQYIEAGSNIIYANTFGANRCKMEGTGFSVDNVVSAAVRNAKTASDGRALVALDIGPIGQLLEPTGALSFEEANDIFSEIVQAGVRAGADLIVIETMTDLYETKAAVLAAKENSTLPVFVTMTFESNMRTFTGCSVSAMCLTMEGLGVDAVGVNCSLGPAELIPIVREIAKWTALPIIVKPNAGLPDPVTGTYDVMPDDFAKYCREMLDADIRILGGCCGTNPDYIRALKEMLSSPNLHVNRNDKADSGNLAICSPLRTVVVDRPRIIGERINPTGKKRFKQALLDGDMDYILSQAIEQVEAGAEILDVNVGAPGIDEKEMMIRTVKAIQSIVDVPLQLDSTKPDVLEAALRIYNGKPIINSVNGEDAVLDRILPLAAKYGAAVIGLTLDENGIPPKAEERFKIAEKILDRARSYGIKKEDVIIDCLVLTVSAEQKAALETLKAVRMVKERLGLRTVLGVSNISFGLPNRININTSFLTMALYAGLDLPIMNPNLPAMMWAIKSFRVLAAIDENSLEYISYSSAHTPPEARVRELTEENEKLKAARDRSAEHPADCTCPRCQSVLAAKMEWLAAKLRQGSPIGEGGAGSRPFQELTGVPDSSETRGSVPAAGKAVPSAGAAVHSAGADAHSEGSHGEPDNLNGSPQDRSDLPRTTGILKAMETGMKKDGRQITVKLLQNTEPMVIINDILIPALDTIGERFEKGKLFLPQLILAADVASECFDEIKTHLAKDGSGSESRGRIILATVKGDIHDIGKNIVKVILENYGYEIIDLGRDVDPGLILETAVSRDVKLIGLSALMTTTLGAMEKTIRLLRENNVDCKIMVGGAVLTPDYAKRIGADYYAKDAKTGADIAKEVFG